MPSDSLTPQDSFVDVGGRQVSVRDWGGQGTPIVLLPGGGCCVIDFTLMAPTLLEQHRVVAIDMRGHGNTDDAPWDWDGQIEDIASVLAELEIERPIIGGHSLGGMVAAMMAERDLCCAAINIDGHGQGKPEQYVGYTASEVEAHFAKGIVERDKVIAAAAPVATAETADQARVAASAQLVAVGFSEQDATERLSRVVRVDDNGDLRTRLGIQGSLGITDAVLGLDLFAIYRATKVPLLIYNATQTLTAPGMDADTIAFHDAFRKGLTRDLSALAAEHALVSHIEMDASHFLIFEEPQLVANQILDFLQAV